MEEDEEVEEGVILTGTIRMAAAAVTTPVATPMALGEATDTPTEAVEVATVEVAGT